MRAVESERDCWRDQYHRLAGEEGNVDDLQRRRKAREERMAHAVTMLVLAMAVLVALGVLVRIADWVLP